MKKILIVTQHFPPENSGNASRIHDLSMFLREHHTVTILAPHPTFPTGTFNRKWNLSCQSIQESITLVNLWTWQPQSNNPSFLCRMAYYIIFPIHAFFWILYHQKKFDVIITSSPPLFIHIPGLFCKILQRKRWITDVRDLWIDASISLGFLKKGSIFERISRKFEGWCFHEADSICVTTNELAKRIISDSIIRKKIMLVPNGVDTAVFTPSVKVKLPHILYTGNVGYAQDLDLVILAMKRIYEEFQISFHIIGAGDIKSILEECARKENLGKAVQFLPPVPRAQMPQVIAESLLGVAPLKKLDTLEYAAPTKVYEYMACGIPFLGCGEGEIRRLADESGAGIIADNSSTAIAEALALLLKDPEKMVRMGKAGREYVVKYYERKTISKALSELIENLP